MVLFFDENSLVIETPEYTQSIPFNVIESIDCIEE